jgi:hypothetical protein
MPSLFRESLGDMEKVGARLPNNQEEETYDT